jgi:AraC-like DNA-binding protein
VVADASVDVLASAFADARARAVVFARLRLGAPWKLACPPAGHAGFHIVEQGECWLEPDDGSPALALAEHDIVLVTHGAGHTLADRRQSAVAPLLVGTLAATHTDGAEIVAGLDGPPTRLVCGGYLLAKQLAAPFLWKLPPFVHVARARASDEARSALALLLAELHHPRSGSPTIVNSLADVLLVHVLRDWLHGLPADERAWLTALQHGPVGRALVLLHNEPAADWNVGTLAGSVGLSRGAFGERFRALTGEPPGAYIGRRRMVTAARLLRETDARVAEVGVRVGYASEYAFNRAFRRQYGISPGRYRAQAPQGSLTTNSHVPSA